MHLFHDVAATHKLTLDVNLGDSWPVWEIFDSLAQCLISKHVEVLVLHPVSVKEDHDVATKTALGLLFCAFHKKYHIVLCYPLLDMGFALFRVREWLLLLRLEIRIRLFWSAEVSELNWHKHSLVKSNCCSHDRVGLGHLLSRDGP